MTDSNMKYSKMFNLSKNGVEQTYDRSGPARLADRSVKPVYEYTPEIELAVNVALATGRPLLVRGPSGSGKSSLARSVAARMGWQYYETIITSRTRAQDLLWSFDSIRRLNDAQANSLKPMKDYIKSGILWWAFNRETAMEFGQDPFSPQPNSPDSVVLIDEIDKAEPDVPNNLLLPIGSLNFYVTDLDIPLAVSASQKHPPFIIITTNDERQLPTAFTRRCITIKLDAPDAERLIKIAEKHFGKEHFELYDVLARHIVDNSKNLKQAEPNAAEYLDAVWACLSLKVSPPKEGEETSTLWRLIRETTLVKTQSVTKI